MYAIIKTGGKQYRVRENQVINIEKLDHTQPDQTIQFDHVLMLVEEQEGIVKMGQPYLESAHVTATVLEHKRAKKIEILKFKRRKHQMKRQGHRQYYTQVKIDKIASAA